MSWVSSGGHKRDVHKAVTDIPLPALVDSRSILGILYKQPV